LTGFFCARVAVCPPLSAALTASSITGLEEMGGVLAASLLVCNCVTGAHTDSDEGPTLCSCLLRMSVR
jgi:hypothetical protein